MALVAFPYTTCITSEDIEDDSLHGPYAMLTAQPTSCDEEESNSNEKDENANENDVKMAEDDDESLPLATETERSTDQPEDSGEDTSTTEPVSPSDETMIDEEMTTLLDEMSVAEEDEATIPTTATNTTALFKGNYGGLRNLGNTCYMNSALQMIASLDHFVEQLQQESPANNADNSKTQLRRCFLDAMASLRRGETVSPDEFKLALDERTSLFVGFRQEDSHEFLTTLLDILDEDYKAKQQQEEESPEEDSVVATEEENNHEEDVAETADVEQEETTEQTTEQTTSDESVRQPTEAPATQPEEVPATSASEHVVTEEPQNRETFEPAAKMARTETMNTVQSFLDLQPDSIEELLRARLLDDSSNNDTGAAPASPPRCKLAGGRMTSPDLHGSVLLHGGEEEDPVASVSDDEEEVQVPAQPPTTTMASPVESYFKTEVTVRLTCDSCKFARSHVENYFHLSLEIGNDSCSVADGLRKFFAQEKREVKCEKCFCETAHQTMEITRLPRALLLHFKRFIVDISDDYSSITYRKNQSDFFFDDKLEFEQDLHGVLSDCCSKDVIVPTPIEHDGNEGVPSHDDEHRGTYNIRSVVNHIGSSASCGHYTADSLRVYPGTAEEERQWTRFNDSWVSKISAEDAIRNSSRTAYMVLYELS